MEQSIPVAVTVALIQVFKLTDSADRFERYYSAIAIFVGLIIGCLFSQRQSEPWLMMQDGIANAAYSALAWQAKKAVLDPVGVAIPGDPKKDQ